MTGHARDQAAEILAAIGSVPDTFYFLDTYHRRNDVREWFQQISASLAAAKTAG